MKEIAFQRFWVMAAQRRAALRDVDPDGQAELTTSAWTPNAETLLARQDAHRLGAAKGIAL